MGSNFYYSIDLNKDQNHQEQPFFYPLGSSSSLLQHQVPSNSSSSSSSISSLSSYLPLLINSHDDQHVAYNNTYHVDHPHSSHPLKANMFVANGGSSSSYDHMVPKKETRLKLTIRKKDHHEGQTELLHQNPTKPNPDSDKWMISPKMRLIKKTITNNKQPIDHTYDNNNHNDHYPFNHTTNFNQDNHDDDVKKVSTRKTTTSTMENRYNTINENGYGNNNGVIRVCSDCNTTKTPLWRSGPRGPKSLCNACGIRQRKARRAAMVAAALATGDQEVAGRVQPLPIKKKLQNKRKRSNGGEKQNLSPPVVARVKKCKIKEEEEVARVAIDSEMSRSTVSSSSSISSNKLCFDDLTIMLSKSSAYNQKVFPQDEKEAAVLLMALSYGMVHG